MKLGKLVLVGIVLVMLVSVVVILLFVQQVNGDKLLVFGLCGFMVFVMSLLDMNKDGKIMCDEFDVDKVKIFVEIDKNGDKKFFYDEVKVWLKDVMVKMVDNVMGLDDGLDVLLFLLVDGKVFLLLFVDGKVLLLFLVDGKVLFLFLLLGYEKVDVGLMGGLDGMDGLCGEWCYGLKGLYGKYYMGLCYMDLCECLVEMFFCVDVNDDGFISQEEFNVMVDCMFMCMDCNGDGVIDMKDMLCMMCDCGLGVLLFLLKKG